MRFELGVLPNKPEPSQLNFQQPTFPGGGCQNTHTHSAGNTAGPLERQGRESACFNRIVCECTTAQYTTIALRYLVSVDMSDYIDECICWIMSLYSYLNMTFVPQQNEDPFTFGSVILRSALCFNIQIFERNLHFIHYAESTRELCNKLEFKTVQGLRRSQPECLNNLPVTIYRSWPKEKPRNQNMISEIKQELYS